MSKFDEKGIEPPRFTSAGIVAPDQIEVVAWPSYHAKVISGVRCFVPDGDLRTVPYDRRALRDLVDMDPRSTDDLCAFMDSWGPVMSLARSPRTARQPFAPTGEAEVNPGMSPELFIDAFDTFEANSIDGSVRAFRAYLDNRDADTERIEGASFLTCQGETEDAVVTVQGVVRTILKASSVGGYPEDVDGRWLLDECCSYASEALAPYRPAIYPARAHSVLTSMPVLAACIADAVSIALDGEPLKQCKHCGRWFQYKESKRGYSVQKGNEGVRRRERRADYCSDECQKAYNYEKLKAKRAAERAEKQGGAE